MKVKKLWEKLFSKKTEMDNIELHIAGATVRHENPFLSIEVLRNEEELPKEFIDKWVVPFYMANPPFDESKMNEFAVAAKAITIDVVKILLGDFNWRPRIAAAYFSAINNYKELDDIMGRHLIKSEVTYAGFGYCLALATFATDNSKSYLKKYLDYYLDRKELYFDQAHVFCALEYLDKDLASGFIEKWNLFISDKPYWDLEKSRKHFEACMLSIKRIREMAKN